jgi:predicted metal-dependent hydrolase
VGGQWGHIKVHPNLSLPKTPPIVIKYVLFHEMLHEHLDSDPLESHSSTFLKHENLFNFREKARNWLSQKGYSVHEDD